ncbi:MAG: M20/M25/M40 family metallo-hydrolase [Bacteroidetes bacterium]|nr:M20/M25/M40 family metallo-hydrolase [Bacteroidota bacterium]
MKKIAVFIGVVLLAIVGIVLFKTLSNTPGAHQKSSELTPLTKEAIAHMTEAIQIKTETPNDAYEFDTATFFAYRKFLEKSYPLVHKNLPRTVVDSFNYIYEWKGTDTSILPMVLMAHYDVVPVEASAVKLWHAAPYGGEVKEGYIWGRGVIDDKSSMIEILEAAEAQLAKGFQPKQTILLCFGADEESSGKGATAVVKYFKSKNQRFDIVVDEGGEISTEDMKEVKRPIASIGVGEKGYVTLILTVQIAGGHSSIPAKSTAIDILSKGLYQLRQNQMPAKLTPPIRAYLERVSSYTENFGKKMALSNLWLFEKQVLSSMSDAPSSNAMVRTTIVPTILNSGVRDNVIPTYATAYVNSRILPGETQKDVYNFVEKTVNDTNIKITYYHNYSTMPSPTTDINSKAFKRVENAIIAVVDDVIVAPMVMLGASDSRNYREVSDGVINFTPITNGKGYHGIDERMLVTDFQKGIHFFSLLIQGSK